MGTLRVGTSGIVLPGTKQNFPQEFQSGSRLCYYSSPFNTLEINSTFYKIPLPSTFERWANEVQDNFKFTVKLWREITHVKKLLYEPENIDRFMHSANHLVDKKGCILVQFPASIDIAYFQQVEKIITQLNELNFSKQWQICVEFRHASWYDNPTYAMLNRCYSTLVLHDIAASKTPLINLNANSTYVRFHGPHGDYKGSYTEDFLQGYARHIHDWLGRKDVYVYFNNTIGGAFQNAQFLKQLI